MNTWGGLSQQFRELKQALQYTRLDAQWGSSGEHWRFAGSSGSNAEKRYAILAQIAGKKLEEVLNPGVSVNDELLAEPNLEWRWYKAMWKIGNALQYNFLAEEKTESGEHIGFIQTGSIQDIAEVASILCLHFTSSDAKDSDTKDADSNYVDKYLYWIKGHKLLAIIIVLGIIVIAVGNFTDAIQKITGFVSSRIGRGISGGSDIYLNIKVKNETQDRVHILPFMTYYVTENNIILSNIPTGRIALPAKGEEDLTVPPKGERIYRLGIPPFLSRSYQFQSGKADIGFRINTAEKHEIDIQTIPLMREAFEKYYVLFRIAPNKAVQPTSPKAGSG
jgi:hypothetical protein